MQAMQNISILNGYEIKKIVTGCPHCFNTIKNEYVIKFIDSFDQDTDDGTHICAVLELLKDSLYNYIKKIIEKLTKEN